MGSSFLVAVGSAAVLVSSGALAQPAGEHRLSWKQALSRALAKHPALATALRREDVAAAKIDVAKSEMLPRAGIVGQLNRSTGSAVPGATFAMPGVAAVVAPPGDARFGSGAFQSEAGVAASWDVLELARVPTLTRAARRELTAAKSQTDVSRLAIAAAAADDFLLVAEARALVTAAEASEARAKTFHEVVAALVDQQLRPDLDLARAETELAAARALLDKTRLGLLAASERLALDIGAPDQPVDVADDPFATLPAERLPAERLPAEPARAKKPHPALVAYDAAAKAAEARASVAKLSYLPKIELAGAFWARGGGYVLDGGPNSGIGAGVLPDTPNWAVGALVSWWPTDMVAGGARARVQNAEAAVERAKADEVAAGLTTDLAIARAALASALAVEQQTRAAVSAAKRAHELAVARYTTGNGNVVEVADADRALAAAERDDAVARLEAWRAVVAILRAKGDVDAIVGLVKSGW